MPATIHKPVMLAEVLAALDPQPGQIIVDGTLGGGGHTRAIAERVTPNGYVLALDGDPEAIARAEVTLRGNAVQLAHARYCDLHEILSQLRLPTVDGILLDLGLSSDQLANAERGFSFDAAGPLDLRFDTTSGHPAWQWLAKVDERDLADVIFRYGEERFSRRIAKRIIAERGERPILTAADLSRLVRNAVPPSEDTRRIDPATRTFQALRIEVNDELGCLERALREFPKYLRPGGTLAVISFHSLEDRTVKNAFREDDRWEVVTKKPLLPTPAETQSNPRARSAKLRVAKRAKN